MSSKRRREVSGPKIQITMTTMTMKIQITP